MTKYVLRMFTTTNNVEFNVQVRNKIHLLHLLHFYPQINSLKKVCYMYSLNCMSYNLKQYVLTWWALNG
jgi:hypothetical protein